MRELNKMPFSVLGQTMEGKVLNRLTAKTPPPGGGSLCPGLEPVGCLVQLAVHVLCDHEHVVMGGVIGRRRRRLSADGNDYRNVELLPL